VVEQRARPSLLGRDRACRNLRSDGWD